MAPGGYLDRTLPSPITGVEEIERLENTWVFMQDCHTGWPSGDHGGRVLGVTTRATSLASAHTRL